MSDYDAILLLSFGGPEGPDDVVPFLENVTRGRGIPRERLVEVGAHYAHFDGVSPINEQNRRLQSSLRAALSDAGHDLPVYWGNRNWHPLLADTVQEMADDGVRHALAITTSAYSSYSACRQYHDDIAAARAIVGELAPTIQKIRPYFDHPGFVESFIDAVADATARLSVASPRLVFTAHSIPTSMAATSDYELQLRTVADLVASAACPGAEWDLVWQSRSGPPQVPWLEPDINDHLRALAADGVQQVVIAPIGFVSDHIEVLWDLDNEAAATAAEVGITMERAESPGTRPDPRFVSMWRALIEEQLSGASRQALSALPERPFPCAEGCCPAPIRTRPSRSPSA